MSRNKTDLEVAQEYYDNAVAAVIHNGIVWARGNKPEWEKIIRFDLGRVSAYRDLIPRITWLQHEVERLNDKLTPHPGGDES